MGVEVLTDEDVGRITDEFKKRLQTAFESSKLITHAGEMLGEEYYDDPWVELRQPYSHEPVDTGVPHDELIEVAKGLIEPTPQRIEDELNALGLEDFVQGFLPPDWKSKT